MAAVPVATYNYNPATRGQPAVTFNMNGETVDFIPMMPSHTAGDTIVRFRKANVIYIEDFYRNFGYPFADQANGGSIKGMLDAVDLIEKLANANTTLVPGHGTLVKKQDLLPYRAMLVDVMAKVKTLRDHGTGSCDSTPQWRSSTRSTRTWCSRRIRILVQRWDSLRRCSRDACFVSRTRSSSDRRT